MKQSDKTHDTNDNVITKTQSTFHTAHMNLITWIDARVIPCAHGPVVRFWSSWFAHHMWLNFELCASLMSSMHAVSVVLRLFEFSIPSNFLKAVVTLRTSPKRRWTQLTSPTSSQMMSSRTTTSWKRRFRILRRIHWQESSTFQMTAAQIMDIISRLPCSMDKQQTQNQLFPK